MKREIVTALAVLASASLLGQYFLSSVWSQASNANSTPATLAAVGQGQDRSRDESARDGRDGNEVLSQAAQQLQNLPPLQAQLRFKINLFDQEIAGPGRYLQKGQGSRLSRIEFEFGSDDHAVRLHQLSDGDSLYSITQALGQTKLEFVDLRQLENLPRGQTGSLAQWISVGSLPGLLRQLDQHFEFSTPVSEQLESVPVLRLTGRWKQASLERLLEGQIDLRETQAFDWEQLPRHLPHGVELTIGADDRFPGFPYRVVFHQFEGKGDRAVAHTVVLMELYQVQAADQMTDEMFRPPSLTARADDVTEFYRNRIRQFMR